ncbi:MAG: GNAT family N-acetyltransferase [Sedimentisphaerales bacterium]|nr:GNAT family N-acetyltransferase [Sedimentisphaerales bacterium]
MKFRQILETDIPALLAIRSATRQNAIPPERLAAMGITTSSVRDMLQTTHHGWLCEDGGRVVGFAIGNGRTGEMWVIAILPDYEGRGIGGRLLRLVEDWLWHRGWRRIWLTTDTDTRLRAYGFYRQQGWIDDGVRKNLRHLIKFAPRPTGPGDKEPPAGDSAAQAPPRGPAD